MHFQYIPYIWPLLASAAVTSALGVYALRRKEVRGSFPFGVCMIVTALWSGGYALEIAGTDLKTMLFWIKVQSMAYSFNPVIWLMMVFLFIEHDRWVTRRNILLLLVLPILTVMLAWTDSLHGLMWQNAHLDMSGAFPVVAKTYGPWFWVIAAYSYFLNIISELLLALSLRRKSSLYREQSLALFIGLALLFLMNALYIFKIGPISRYDLTPVAAGVSGLIIAWGIFRYRLFDIVPVARENIIENIDDGLIVLDAQNRIADLNPAAKAIFGGSIAPIGWEAAAFFKDWPPLAEICFERGKLPGELAIETDGAMKIFEVSCLDLTDRRGKHTGLSIIFHDVTERRMTQAKLLEQQRELAILEERERLARDLHDNLGQVFGFINLQAQAIKQELANAGIDTAVPRLERLVEAAQSAHGEMLEAIRPLKAALPAVKIVMLTSFDDDAKLFEAVKRGAAGYLLKNLKADELWTMLAALERGDAPLSPGLAVRLLAEFARQAEEKSPDNQPHREEKAGKVTERQAEVLNLVAQGRTYKEIGAALGLSERTVKYHMERILELLRLENRAQVIAYAAREGAGSDGK